MKPSLPRAIRALALLVILTLAGCATQAPRPAQPAPGEVRALVHARLPAQLVDRDGWARDIEQSFTALEVTPTVSHLCAALAVIAQESGFQADPVVPGLATIARGEIDRRAAEHHIPRFAVAAALQVTSPNGRSYAERLQRVRSEGELSRIYEDLVGSLPLGKRLFGDANPVRTGGPMQVGVSFAERWAGDHAYPYAPLASVRREVFARRGGLYFGIAHLLAYPVSYDRMLYRFADYNAGFYASRNAAFQNAVNRIAGTHLALDGDLISYRDQPGATERAVLALAPELGLSTRAVRNDLQDGEALAFEDTRLYRSVFTRADKVAGRPLPRAVLPKIRLDSPKITRKLTTAWFATRVDDRYRRCLAE